MLYSARGDFGGVSADGTSQAATLAFDNLTGPISGLLTIGQLQAHGDVQGVTVADGIGKISANGLGDITFETDPNGPATPVSITLGPDGQQGLLAFGNQRPTLYQVDANGNLTALTDPDGNLTTTTYDSNGYPATLVNSQGTWTFHYDADGKLQQQISPTGQTRTLPYDNSTGFLLSDTTTDAQGNVLDQATYTPDSAGHVLSAANASGTYASTYNDAGQLATATTPQGLTLTYTHDVQGNVTGVADSAGGTTVAVYNSLNQVTEQDFTAPGQAPLRVDFTYASNGKVASETQYGDLAGTVLLGST